MSKFRTHLLTTATVAALSGGAYAADMPLKVPAPAPIPYTNWQGFYVGGHIGVASLDSSCTTTYASGSYYGGCGGPGYDGYNGLSSAMSDTNGFLGGVQAGYDWQDRYFVYGVVADWTAASLSHTQTGNWGSLAFQTSKVDWLASFRGRMGLAVDNTLVYVTGGLALAEIKSSAGQYGGCPTYCFSNALSGVKTGWVSGFGVEHKLNQNWSVLGEALYYDMGHASATSSSATGGVTYSTEFSTQIFEARVGANYRF
jgi:outer membrane immunogenic protein